MSADTDLKKIANGITPEWEQTFEHPVFGPLTFKAKLPKAKALAAHSIEMDEQLGQMEATPRPSTMVLVAAIAGVKTLLERPVIRERREYDESVSREVVHQDLYDPEEEVSEEFLADVWMAFSLWRNSFLLRVGELGNSSGETTGSSSSEPSSEPTDSPSTTLA